jgi:hypothetical protein
VDVGETRRAEGFDARSPPTPCSGVSAIRRPARSPDPPIRVGNSATRRTSRRTTSSSAGVTGVRSIGSATASMQRSISASAGAISCDPPSR